MLHLRFNLQMNRHARGWVYVEEHTVWLQSYSTMSSTMMGGGAAIPWVYFAELCSLGYMLCETEALPKISFASSKKTRFSFTERPRKKFTQPRLISDRRTPRSPRLGRVRERPSR